MQQFSMAPSEMVASLWRNRYLIKTSIQREVVGRYRGSFMGILWSFFNPIFMLAVYTFVFSVVFKARWHAGSDSKTQFALILFAGLMVFNVFAECVNRAPGLILANTSYVKKVVFPLEILPLVNIGGALFHLCISFVVWLLAFLFLFGTPHLTILLFPVILLPLILFTAGISWWLASIGVYLRDVSQVINIVTTALMFLSPIFYSIASLPEKFQVFMNLNPLTPIIEQTRNILFWNKLPDLPVLAVCYAVSMVVAYLGFAWFQKTRKGFADVL
ncbi:ABC transporter permease [Desulfoprunum benzoelyticum]|uniref:Transport permease protein n=1 Tax=Desulfoprunum benzoelyticum TaxID=1506996 RepID=A0A840UJT0_9BACT|nr:ABC transporter permease [Desulfoprunum benzoelyticum]MBB5346597.1 lipopolysaccharide transport system permease protein [Desulfoprunum benzoelyticum]MBM9528874.1 ABC transporter permease [Desulfoprunum benzoelyticum]